MQPIFFDPAVAGVGIDVVGSTMQAVAAGAAASPSMTVLIPAGAEEVSAQAAAAFAAEATQLLALVNGAHAELARTGSALVEIARMYSETDAAAAGSLQRIRPPISFPLAG
ncbi:PE domain-containing protein [Mycobacterium montefiorense]|uniref:PE domain-containing protein n=1 Tax=Mycobacterium montefiorense TaxID=154654 RepID=UPI0021F2BDA8|nr:PE domain-containing protein [Mycobacterium montefiorense]MCV7429795.1 PE domain-containing protein [Mycobacterium montefiorense]